MVKENKSGKILLRHLSISAFSALLVYLFYLSYASWGVKVTLFPDWGADHPFWRAWAHAAFVLLFLSLIVSPAAKLWKPMGRYITWRREFGIWFAILSFGHGYAIWDRWAHWDVARLFGFEYIEEVGGYILFRPEVGIMNMMGLIIAPMIILLAITSFDSVVKTIGVSSWKWLHSTLVHVIFYVVMLRGVLYLFYFFQYSPPNWRTYPPIWFLYVFLSMGVFVVLLQACAFAKTVFERRSGKSRYGILQVVTIISISILIVMPLVLMTGTVAYFDSKSIKELQELTENTLTSENYSKNYELIIHDENREIQIWARNLDSNPYFRQTTKISGEMVLDQIYRYSEQTLYIAEFDETTGIVWYKVEDVGPDEIGILDVAIEPGKWAEQYGTGKHQIQSFEGQLEVTIHKVGEQISDELFEIPNVAEFISI